MSERKLPSPLQKNKKTRSFEKKNLKMFEKIPTIKKRKKWKNINDASGFKLDIYK